MKYCLILLCLITGTCWATQMKGFGTKYYDNFTENYSDNHATDRDLVPTIVLGNKQYKFEVSTVEDIAKQAGVSVNKDNQASWICLKSKDINYWFISDNEMGGGYLTAVALAKDASPCTSYKGVLRVVVKAPMLASREDISSYFVRPNKDIVMFYKEVEKSKYIQSNSILYYLRGKEVQGLFISQVTTT